MPLPFFGRRRKRTASLPAPRVHVPPDQLDVEDFGVRLQYHALSSHGVRTPGGPDVLVLLPQLLDGFNLTPVELIEPLPVDFQDAAPTVLRSRAALAWINAHHGRTPIARHALYILETLDAIDLAYETFAVALLHGDVDGEGFPRFDSIVGGPVSYWDERTGELVVRMIVGWGGEGVRGDTQRIAQRLLARLMGNLLDSHGASELGRVERPVAFAGEDRRPCPHCGFAAIDRRSHYCPKCGMRMPGG